MCKKWISVKDRLPEGIDTVLIAMYTNQNYEPSIVEPAYMGFDENKNRVWKGYSIKGTIFINDKDITHWMPLPNPPEKNYV